MRMNIYSCLNYGTALMTFEGLYRVSGALESIDKEEQCRKRKKALLSSLSRRRRVRFEFRVCQLYRRVTEKADRINRIYTPGPARVDDCQERRLESRLNPAAIYIRSANCKRFHTRHRCERINRTNSCRARFDTCERMTRVHMHVALIIYIYPARVIILSRHLPCRDNNIPRCARKKKYVARLYLFHSLVNALLTSRRELLTRIHRQ